MHISIYSMNNSTFVCLIAEALLYSLLMIDGPCVSSYPCYSQSTAYCVLRTAYSKVIYRVIKYVIPTDPHPPFMLM